MTVSSEPAAPGRSRSGRPPISCTVVRTEILSPSMVRIVLGGPGLAQFSPNEFADAYVKLVFPAAQPEQRPYLRTYTVRHWDAEMGELTLDFVVHGDAGLAGPWARSAKPGDTVQLNGPGGGYTPDLDADWHLLVGDESALPAIAVALERLPATAVGHVFVEVPDSNHEQALSAPPGVVLSWVHHGDLPRGQALIEAVTALAFPAGQVHAFVHGEAGTVRQLRRLLKGDRGIPLNRLSISGYWRVGVDDEAWRAAKAEWNREIEGAEQAGAPSPS